MKRSKESPLLLYTHMLDQDVRVNYDAIRVGFPSVHAQAGRPPHGAVPSLGREQLQFFEAAYLPRILQVDIEQMDIVWLTLGIAKDRDVVHPGCGRYLRRQGVTASQSTVGAPIR